MLLTQPIPSYAEISCVKNSGRVSNRYHSKGPMENPTIIAQQFYAHIAGKYFSVFNKTIIHNYLYLSMFFSAIILKQRHQNLPSATAVSLKAIIHCSCNSARVKLLKLIFKT